ncbi:MAG: permease, superfamily [Chitinophagaceae bacterium]|nr:permease, superfamily [Chitinophagaceae bacterium]
MSKPTNLHQGAFYVFISAAGFSIKAIFAKKAYEVGADPITLLFLRLLFAAPLFLLLAYWNATHNSGERRISKKEILSLIGLGILGYYLSSLMDFVGLSYISASLERIILFSYPTIVVLLTALFFRSSLDRKDYLALLITYLGIFIVFSEELKQSVLVPMETLITGGTLVFGSACTYALYLIGSGFIIPRIGAARFTAYSMLIATVTMMLHYLLAKGITFPSYDNPIIWYGLAMAIFSTFMPAYFLSKGIKLIGSERSSVISTIGPVSTIVLANIVLGETMTWVQVGGTLIVIAGVLIISLKTKKENTTR